jgi:hypothetical protein
MQEYSDFKKYSNKEQAKEVKIYLEKNDIKAILSDNEPVVDITFAGNTLQNEYVVKIRTFDFPKAKQLMESLAQKQLDLVDESHYLFTFNNDELFDILQKPDEWSEFDFLLAKKILSNRGENINDNKLKELQESRIEKLSEPDKSHTFWIVLGYIFAIAGGLLGLVIGYVLMTSKKSLPNGQKVYSYSFKDRNHGKNILYCAFIALILSLVFKILNVF